MARRRRDTEAGLFHVWAHSVWSADLFADDLDRARGVSELARATQRQPWVCLAAVLMTTHYHLILDVEDDALPLGMQALNFRYAAGYNARHRLRGHVFSGRYGSRRLKTEADLLDTYRYVVWNPVRAGLCTRPEDWRWSSYPATLGRDESFTFVEAHRVLEQFGQPRERATARLRLFVAEGFA
jgi:REP element-mobilizing transposase RayT